MSGKIIVLVGKSKSGKDTIGDMLRREGGGACIAFADKLKAVCGELFGLSTDQMYTEEGKAAPTTLRCLTCPLCGSVDARTVQLEREWKTECKSCGAVGEDASFKSNWTPRMILQHVGTEGFRRVDPNVWVNYAMRTANKMLDSNSVRKASDPVPPFVVITDGRFRSEIAAVVAAGGQVWRVRRPETDAVATGLAKHASETEMDTIPDSTFNRVIMNDGSLEDLRGKVSVALSQFLGR